jgi:hypothetical protein
MQAHFCQRYSSTRHSTFVNLVTRHALLQHICFMCCQWHSMAHKQAGSRCRRLSGESQSSWCSLGHPVRAVQHCAAPHCESLNAPQCLWHFGHMTCTAAALVLQVPLNAQYAVPTTWQQVQTAFRRKPIHWKANPAGATRAPVRAVTALGWPTLDCLFVAVRAYAELTSSQIAVHVHGLHPGHHMHIAHTSSTRPAWLKYVC